MTLHLIPGLGLDRHLEATACPCHPVALAFCPVCDGEGTEADEADVYQADEADPAPCWRCQGEEPSVPMGDRTLLLPGLIVAGPGDPIAILLHNALEACGDPEGEVA